MVPFWEGNGVPMSKDDLLNHWLGHLAPKLGVDPEIVPLSGVLDVAADVAHTVLRPGAPLSTFVAGLAAGQRGGSPEDIAEVLAEVIRAADDWEPPPAE